MCSAANEKALQERRLELRHWPRSRRGKVEQRTGTGRGLEEVQQYRIAVGACEQCLEPLLTPLPPWSGADEDTRFEILALLDAMIVKRHEQMGLPPFDDGWPSGRESVFVTIMLLVFPHTRRPPGRSPA